MKQIRTHTQTHILHGLRYPFDVLGAAVVVPSECFCLLSFAVYWECVCVRVPFTFVTMLQYILALCVRFCCYNRKFNMFSIQLNSSGHRNGEREWLNVIRRSTRNFNATIRKYTPSKSMRWSCTEITTKIVYYIYIYILWFHLSIAFSSQIRFVHISSARWHFCDGKSPVFIVIVVGDDDDIGSAFLSLSLFLSWRRKSKSIDSNVSTCELTRSNCTFKEYYYHFLLSLSISFVAPSPPRSSLSLGCTAKFRINVAKMKTCCHRMATKSKFIRLYSIIDNDKDQNGVA